MNVSDVFTVDQAAVDELKLEVTAGQQYRISQPVNGVEVRASKVVGGKPQKGRPRRFPVALVARLMGVPVPVVTEEATEETQEETSTPSATTEALEGLSDEQRTEATEAVARATSEEDKKNIDW